MLESDDFKKFWLECNVDFQVDVQKKLIIGSLGEMLFDFTSFDLSSNPKIKIAVHTPSNEETATKLKYCNK